MNNMEIFRSKEFGSVRVLKDGDKYLFCGSDVAKALGYARPNDALSRHCRYTAKRSIPHPQAAGKTIEMAFIPEGDVYRLIIGSKLPSAERFEHWVFDEVLPCIRKHGAYMTDSFAEKVASDPNVAFVLAEQLLREHEERKRLSAELEKALPKAEYVDAFITPGSCTNIRTTAKELGVPERWFCRFLIEVKFAYRMQPYGNLLPYARPETSGFFVVKDYTRNGHFGSYMLITPEGKNHLRRLIFTESAVAED